MRAALTILFLAFLAAVGAQALFDAKRAIVEAEPVAVTAEAPFTHVLAATGHRERLRLDVETDGPAVLTVGGRDTTLDAGRDDCATTATGALRCRLALPRPDAGALSIAMAPAAGDGALVIRALSATPLTAKAMSPLSNAPFQLIAVILLAALPVIWLTHRDVALSQWIIIAVSLAALSLIQVSFTVVLLAFATAMWAVNMKVGRLVAPRARLLLLLLGGSLTFLVAFKTFGPFLNGLIAAAEANRLLLPLGISYFVMRVIDTQLKAYRGQLKDYSFREFLCYLLFAPTVPAGPIETIENFKANRLARIGREDVAYGLSRVILGVAKKVLIADAILAPMIERSVYPVALAPDAQGPDTVAMLLFANFLFAYIDFSAYSDIAIGLSRLFGYRITENFNWPVLRRNLREYWQNWHMSLSNWAMRNIYMPVAVGTRNKYVPIYATMIAIGLWHVLGLPWFLWAMHHATGLTVLGWLETRTRFRLSDVPVIGPALGIVATVGFVAIGHSFVLFDDVETGLAVYARAWGLFGLLW